MEEQERTEENARITIQEVCACGSSITVVDADPLALLAVEFWADRHKAHGWREVRRVRTPATQETPDE